MLRLQNFLLFLVLLSCQATNDPAATQHGGQNPAPACLPRAATRPDVAKVLFIGNSLTYTNDLPSLVAAIGADKGNLIEKEMIAKPNYALEDHWGEGCIQKMIESGFYDFVVIQQGPSSQPDGAQSLLEYGGKIQELCKANDTKLAFFQVWPAKINYQTFPGVIANYMNAAYSTGAILCPVGYAWKQYMDKTNDFSYYGPDEFHPSMLGSAVAADIIYKALFP